MRAVVQRVRSASVDVVGPRASGAAAPRGGAEGDRREERSAGSERDRIAAIGPGLVVLLGVGVDDRPEDGERLAAKVASLRIFDDERGKMSRSVGDVGGEVLVVPQFTLYGDVRQGRRPDFTKAAAPEKGQRLYDAFCGVLRGSGLRVETGSFGASMRVALEGDGPVTIVASTDRWSEGEIGG